MINISVNDIGMITPTFRKEEGGGKETGGRIKRCAILQYTLLWTMHMYLPFGDLKFDGSHMTALHVDCPRGYGALFFTDTNLFFALTHESTNQQTIM